MMLLSREEIKKLIGMKDSQWESTTLMNKLIGKDDSQWDHATRSRIQSLLHELHQRRRSRDTERDAYSQAASFMFLLAFNIPHGQYYDAKRKCLWSLGRMVRCIIL